ncbi:hypothetical protein ACFT5B_14165 [Luteimicrobium sp. NPDC057192]|uniref:hypothetical protein n=1 Tax=Luteimicrobium sp. NPDC057192 TaxID=3346042 RepID=UPI00362F9B78
MFDVKKLTLGEVAKIEELSGQPITAIGEDEAPKGKTMAAVAFVVKRRQILAAGGKVSEFTWNDACSLTFAEASELIGVGKSTAEGSDEAPDGDPTTATAASTPKSSARKTSRGSSSKQA